MSKRKKNKGAKKREKRQQARREKTRQKKRAVASGELRRESESLEGMKTAPPPEFLPGSVLVAGAMLPIIAVRFAPSWPAWAFFATWAAALVVATLIARSLARRRVPKWDPVLFFGIGGLLAMLLWTHDAGAVWIVNHQKEAVTWSVDGGIESELAGRQRARLDLRAGSHAALIGGEPAEFEIGARQRAVINHGDDPCVLLGAQRFTGAQIVVPEGVPDPVLCPRRDSEAGAGSP